MGRKLVSALRMYYVFHLNGIFNGYDMFISHIQSFFLAIVFLSFLGSFVCFWLFVFLLLSASLFFVTSSYVCACEYVSEFLFTFITIEI